MRPKGTPEELKQRRTQAIRLLHQGYSYTRVARMVRVTPTSVERWRHTYTHCGLHGLDPKPVIGRPVKLTIEQRKELIEALIDGPLEFGFTTDAWTLARIRRVIRTLFGIRCSMATIWRLLTGPFGWSYQRPVKRARERDERAIRRWKYVTWPAIKKTLTG